MSTHRLSLGRKLGFTLGDYASNLYWQSVSIFLLFFYTDAVGLSAATAGLIYMIASIIDAIADPIMGSIADRTRTSRGRYRPYILFGCGPLGLSFILLYYRPPFEGAGLAIWLMATHVIFRFAYTAVTIPYTSLNARLTDSSDERSTIAGLRMIFAVIAALTIAFLTQRLVVLFGKGDAATGYMWAAAVFALVATTIYPMVYAVTREPPEPPGGEKLLTLGGNWRALAGNRAFWVLMLASCIGFVCSVALGKSVLYYFKYVIGDAAAASTALTAMSAVGLAAIPFWVWVTKLIGKRNVWFAAGLWSLAMLAIFAVFDFHDPMAMTIWLVSISVGSLGLSFTFWSMLPDTVEYGEWRSGARTESFIFGLGQFFLKAALGIGAGVFGALLDWAGYVPNAVQSPETLSSIKWIMVGLPGVGLLGALLSMLLYPLGKTSHDDIVTQLAIRRGLEPNAEGNSI